MSPNCIPGTTPDCINAQPKGILIWRSLTQWLGGMGIIMLGLMLLSRVLGGGMALARAELTGPSLSRLRPKLQETALALWTIYIILTALEIVLLWGVGGMTIFDAFNHGLPRCLLEDSQHTMLRLRTTIVSLLNPSSSVSCSLLV